MQCGSLVRFMKTIILFDLDGTLTDPKEGITKAVQYALRAYGVEEEDLDKLCPFIGPPLTDSFQEFYGFTEKDARAAIPIFHEYFTDRGMYENKVYPGIPEMLSDLREAGCVLAVATSKPEIFAEQILDHFGLLGYFHLVGGADMNETRVRKGEIIEYTLKRLEREVMDRAIDRAEVLMVGDRMHDVMGAAEAGVPCVGVLYGYGGREELVSAGADYLAESVGKLGKLLSRLAGNQN